MVSKTVVSNKHYLQHDITSCICKIDCFEKKIGENEGPQIQFWRSRSYDLGTDPAE